MEEEDGEAEPDPEGEAEAEEDKAEGTTQGEGLRGREGRCFKKSSSRCLLACVPEIPVWAGRQQPVVWLKFVNPELLWWLTIQISRVACLTMGNIHHS